MEGIGHVGAQEADLSDAARPEEVDRVRDGVGDPRGYDALTLADQAVRRGAPAVLREVVGAHLANAVSYTHLRAHETSAHL
eukprot:7150522-Alexandrium_andersonii.AAC.1